MIPKASLIAAIIHHPTLSDRRYAKPPVLDATVVETFLGPAVDRVILSHEWDFALSVADQAIVAGQSDYVLRGNSSDCRQVFNVRYGSGVPDEGYALLDKRTTTSIDAYLDGRTVSGVWGWVQVARTGKYPTIRIIDTPSDTTKQLRYRYWVNNLTYESLPDGCNFDFLVMDAVLEELVPELKMTGRFMERLAEVIRNYQPPAGEDDPAVIDPYTRFRNNERNKRYGYS